MRLRRRIPKIRHHVIVEDGVTQPKAAEVTKRLEWNKSSLAASLRWMLFRLRGREHWLVCKPVGKAGVMEWRSVLVDDNGVTSEVERGKCRGWESLTVPVGFRVVVRNHFKAIRKKGLRK
jgi:hypothetical protein